jgi:outer membrane biosynthesis protein TonB
MKLPQIALPLLCLYASLFHLTLAQQNDVLHQTLNLPFVEASLKDFLQFLQKEHQIKISYSDSYLPLQTKIRFESQKATLEDFFEQVSTQTGIEYKWLNKQIVLKTTPESRKRQQKLEPKKQSDSKPTLQESPTKAKNGLKNEVKNEKETASASHKMEMETTLEKTQTSDPDSAATENQPLDSLSTAQAQNLDPKPQENTLDSLENLANLNALDSLPTQNTQNSTKIRPFQFSFVYPLATGGAESPQYTNRFSFNLLYGRNGGVKGFEAGAFVNTLRDSLQGFQAAGFANVVLGSSEGFQTAGFLNVVKGSQKGFQTAGFANIVGKNVKGFQGAGFINVAGGDSLEGFQAAGFMNKAKYVRGVQAAGFINIAKKVKGSQIGFINIADSVSGVAIGFINIIKNGYTRFEVSTGDIWHTQISYKAGVRKCYTFATAAIRFNDQISWAVGAGLGSQARLMPHLYLGGELIALQVNERRAWSDGLNTWLQFRPALTYEFGRRFSLFAAPTLNLMLSNHYDKETRKHGSSLPKKPFFERNFEIDDWYEELNVKAWVGFSLGILL